MITEIGKECVFRKVFDNTGENFSAFHDAEKFCFQRQITIGPMCRNEPIGVVINCTYVAKWRNLTQSDKESLDGVIKGNFRNGKVILELVIEIPE